MKNKRVYKKMAQILGETKPSVYDPNSVKLVWNRIHHAVVAWFENDNPSFDSGKFTEDIVEAQDVEERGW